MNISQRFKSWFGCLTIDDLIDAKPTHTQIRSKAKILIIDDQPFVHEQALRSAGFNIKVQNQWNDVKDVKDYDMIISDNQGVAQSLGANCDGLSMIKEARKMYPEKKYVVYSANLPDLRDENLNGLPVRTKGDKLDMWTGMMDDILSELYDPKLQWRQINHILEHQNVSESMRRKLQNQYVKSVLTGKDNIGNTSWNVDQGTLSLIERITSTAINAAKLAMSVSSL